MSVSTESLSGIKQRVQKDGTVLMSVEDSFFTSNAFDELESLCAKLPYELVEAGDVGEPNFVNVGRFMTDVERPENVNRPLSDRAVEIVSDPDIIAAFQEILNVETLHVRRMQVNEMTEGGFVGQHRDKDSNPDYYLAVIFQMGQEFAGGDFVVHGGGRPPRVFQPRYRSITISNCDLPHEVTPVTAGKRVSLIYFLSHHGGDNRRVQGNCGGG